MAKEKKNAGENEGGEKAKTEGGGAEKAKEKKPKAPKEKKPGKEIDSGIKATEVKASLVAAGKPQGTTDKKHEPAQRLLPSNSIKTGDEIHLEGIVNPNNANTPAETFGKSAGGRKSISRKFIGIPLEWNSQKVKDEELNTAGFSCCIVLVAEESGDLSEYADFLYQAVNTGVRKRFIALKGEEIAAKVFQYMTSAQMREPGEDEDTHLGRMDLWAEAIKYCLLQCKTTTDTELVFKAKEKENLGARSKDILQTVPALVTPLKTTGKSEEDIREQETTDTPKREPLKSPKDKVKSNNSSQPSNEMHNSGFAGHSSIKKRGEFPMPFLEQIDDVPVNGSKCYVILQGFYNPRLIPEMKKIGVPVNGILLLTNNEQEKKNFSIYDIEENIAGTFIPRNVLPDYVNIIQRRNSNAFKRQNNAVITQFWMELAALINNAPLQSCLHDIALLNCPLPKPEIELDTPEGRGIYATQIFDEAAQRIYEMHVLIDWFQEYKQAVYVRQITPIEAEIPHTLYERLVKQVPAECITVPIIMECMLEQVMANVVEKKKEVTDEKPNVDLLGGHLHINLGPEWGITAFPKKGDSDSRSTLTFEEGSTSSKRNGVRPLFHKPKFIRSGDYASMRTAHLTENFGSHLASSQVTGDFHRLESILWQDLPEFNKGLYMKLLGNLNHFMYFLPPDTIRLEDMFFILHLLMSAGVETHLQKLAEQKEKERQETAKRNLPVPLSLLINTHGPGADVHYIPGTQLLSDHNYLTINEEDALHFILAPTGNDQNEMTVSELGQTKVFKADTPETPRSEYGEFSGEEEIELEVVSTGDNEEDSSISQNQNRRKSSNQEGGESIRKTSIEEPKSVQSNRKRSSNASDAAGDTRRVSQVGEEEDKKHSVASTQGDARKSFYDEVISEHEEEEEVAGESVEEEHSVHQVVYEAPKPKIEVSHTPPNTTTAEQQYQQYGGFGAAGQKPKRFISCEEEYYKDLNDYSTFKTLLECPALLTISNNGGLDLTKWVETYLDCKGLTAAAGEGMMIGQLKDWNFVEEFLPTQMIQVLSEAIGSYLSLQRMYCPFYDTILFIFNNPTPQSLQSDSNFISKIQTLPGLQHFLEYTINDEEVLHWIMQLEQKKGVEIVDSFSADTLMKIVPEDQWVLAPSIKERIIKRKLAKERKVVEEEQAKMEKNYQILKPKAPVPKKKPGDEFKESAKRRQSRTNLRKTSDDAPSEEKKRKNSKRTNKSKIERNKSKNEEEKKDIKSKSISENVKKDSKISEEGEVKKDKLSPKEDEVINVEVSESKEEKKPAGKSRKQSFNFTDAVKYSKGLKIPPTEMKKKLFQCYDLGKRMVITAVDTFHMFPLDGSIIQYEIATIEPEYRMMQLSITKNSHTSYFYPYYIPHDLDLSLESYVVVPYFHLVHSNGTIFAFQDLRARESAPYVRYCLKTKSHTKKFNYEKIVFAQEFAEKRKQLELKKQLNNKRQSAVDPAFVAEDDPAKVAESHETPTSADNQDLDTEHGESTITAEGEMEGDEDHPAKEEKPEGKRELSEDESEKGSKGKRNKKEKDKDKDKKVKDNPKPDKKKQTKDKSGGIKESKIHELGHQKNDTKTKISRVNPADIAQLKESEVDTKVPEIINFPEDITGEWIYPASENSDEEDTGDGRPKRKKSFYAHTWDDAEKILSPLVHSFKVTFPSGLVIQVSDVIGPPLSREIKQWYADKGSATSLVESSRYYTSNGSVVKFMLNSTIQVINARGVTTTIREVSANVNREKNNIRKIFTKATAVKVFEGDVILPTGEYWKISKGSKFFHNPLFLFSGGQLPGGETFRRRQDGVIYLHRHDGTVICHYPDGTRFTTRMVIMKDPVEEFEDWVFVGMKTMVEHPNYATVLFNSLSGNAHLKLPHGEWVRIFADGGIKVGTGDDYTLDVDYNRAVLSFPSCAAGNCGEKKIPNVTAVKLFHTSIPTENQEAGKEEVLKKVPSKIDPIETDLEEAQLSGQESNSSFENPNVETTGKLESIESTIGSDPNRKTSVKSLKQPSNDIIIHPVRKSIKSVSIEEFVGEVEEVPEEIEIPLNASEQNDTILERQRKNIEAQNKAEEIRLEVQDFLQFTDVWTLCKSIDSWDNRFAITVFGEKTVDKSNRFEKEMCVSTESLLNTFANTKQKSQSFLPGILPTTSSENLIKLSKRITAFRQAKIGDCGKPPKTKIFVVKRDLSGYQFLKQSEVDSVLRKVRSRRESVVVTDTLPNIPPRKFITVMEPVNASEKPNGMWHSTYREPMFRPRVLNNKQLYIARPEDLRWFGYVLSTAHGKRPKFVVDPKERYLANKARASQVQEQPSPSVVSPESSENEPKEQSGMAELEVADINLENENKQLTSEGAEGDVNISEETVDEEKSKEKKDLARKSKDNKESKKDKKKKKDEGQVNRSKDKKKISIDSSASTEKRKDLAQKDGKAKSPNEGVAEDPNQVNTSTKENKASFFSKEDSYGEYPDDVLDFQGIYTVEGEVKPKISSQQHAELCTRHKSIVVRNFIEIPQIDENLQSTLISASMCYGKTVDNQMDIYKTYELDDPKYEEERQRQKFIKQQLIEQNLEDMHLYEQAQGKVLSFHF